MSDESPTPLWAQIAAAVVVFGVLAAVAPLAIGAIIRLWEWAL